MSLGQGIAKPPTLLGHRSRLLDLLGGRGLRLVWMIRGEKVVLTGHGAAGRLTMGGASRFDEEGALRGELRLATGAPGDTASQAVGALDLNR